MAMNLRENKIDEFNQKKPKKQFSWGVKKAKSQVQIQKKIQQPMLKKKLNKPVQPKKISRKNVKKVQQPVQQSTQQSQPSKVIKPIKQKTEKWVRKAPKEPLLEKDLDYQEKIEYKKEYSQYIKNRPDDVLVHWRGPDFEHYPKDKKYYTGISIVVAGIILYAALTGSIIMAMLFALIWLVGYLQLSQSPKVIDFAITYDGILVGDEIFDYDSIKSFWIFYEPPHTRIISLHIQGGLRPYLHIPLHQIDPVIVHKKLVEFIPEEKQEQNIADILERLLHM